MSVYLRAGFDITHEFLQPTPLILLAHIHESRESDIIVPDTLTAVPPVPATQYIDAFGNRCTRFVAPAGTFQLTAEAIIKDNGPDHVPFGATQSPVEELPEDTLMYLLASRYCDTDLLLQTAWQLFGGTHPGHSRVQAICDFVHNHIYFNYQNARNTRTASEAFNERTGVCRDFAHLAITFCRCMNIPARYCTGHLGDVGTPPPYPPGDFSAWFEAYIGGNWYIFDARFNVPRASRILMARGRDASDVPIVTTFGPSILKAFRVWVDEIPEDSFSESLGILAAERQ